MAKKKTRGWYTKKIQEIAKRFAKERDNYICQRSGQKVEGCNAHGSHVIPVSVGLALAWDLENIKCLSYHNHINWWHKNPLEAAEWFKEKFPKRWEYLESMKYKRLDIRTSEIIDFYNRIKSCSDWEEYSDVYDAMIKDWIV